VFGIGLPELIVILVLALIVLGPEKLPQVAKQVARFAGELKKASEEFRQQLDIESLKKDLKPDGLGKDVFSLNELEKSGNGVGDLSGSKSRKSLSDDTDPGGQRDEWKPAEGSGNGGQVGLRSADPERPSDVELLKSGKNIHVAAEKEERTETEKDR